MLTDYSLFPPQGQEAQLRERVAQLEAELQRARHAATAGYPASPSASKAPGAMAAGAAFGAQGGSAHGGAMVDASLVEELRRDLTRARARISELESDFVSLEVKASDGAAMAADAEMRQALSMAAAFKKRYTEHKIELDNVRATYARLQATLDETHAQLQVRGGGGQGAALNVVRQGWFAVAYATGAHNAASAMLLHLRPCTKLMRRQTAVHCKLGHIPLRAC